MDVDDFKLFNDSYGHPEGDIVLKTLAEVIKTEIRESDYGFRYGGEEFTVIFSNSTIEQALGAAERIRLSFAGQVFYPRNKTGVSVTVSMGLAQLRPKETPADFIQKADTALYQAKHRGKNCIVTSL